MPGRILPGLEEWAMPYIKNRNQLLSHGHEELRRTVLEIVEYALDQTNPYRVVQELVRLDDSRLTVADLSFQLQKRQRIFILGAGKATYPIARALEDILGPWITDGVVICKHGQEGGLNRSRLYLAGHPIPDLPGFEATKEALALAQATRPGDIVFACITGGSSALMPYPVDGVTLEEKKRVNQLLLTCGANIYEINAVRKHLSRVKGGRLALAMHPETCLINLTVSDVTGDELDYITDPTVPDTSGFEDARSTLTKYGLWEKLPPSVCDYLTAAAPGQETPKQADLAGRERHDLILIKGDAACNAAFQKASEMGLNAMVLSTQFEGESRELGRNFAAIAKEIIQNGRPLEIPCLVVGGGETTVSVNDSAGLGGPNQEFALAAALEIEGTDNIVVVGVDSDGTDGPTSLAGGIVDGLSAYIARKKNVDLFSALKRHDVTPVMITLGDGIETGNTGTNVNDLKLMLIR
jgi:glycerate-2-kinase